MRIEAFSEAREPAHPHTNEDALVILPGRAYAVIDGVTDRNGTRYDGMLAGRYAARVVAHALTTLFATDAPAAEAVVPALTAALRAAYARHGVTPDPANWGGRMCCTLALAIPRDGDAVDVVLVGDSGIRLDGGPVLQMHKDLDQITALLRAAAWPHIRGDAVAREQIARQVVFHGIRQTIAGLDLDAIGTAAAAACHASLPHVPTADIAFLLEGGIVNGQGHYQNHTDSVLGYACLDGFAVPPGLIRVERHTAQTIEAFTDGYARPAPGFGITAWEADFAATERLDPSKIGPYKSVKGSIPGRWSDDRTYLGVTPS